MLLLISFQYISAIYYCIEYVIVILTIMFISYLPKESIYIMPRFNVNQVVPAIGFDLQMQNGNRNIGFVTPVFGDTILDIRVTLLTCISEYKVSWSEDPKGEKEHDGFIFQNQEGDIYHNQYPYADYGQLNDTADCRFKMAIKPEIKGYWSLHLLDDYLSNLHNHIATSAVNVAWYMELEERVIGVYKTLAGRDISFKPFVYGSDTIDGYYEVVL